jgi:hypothetical protein
LPGLLWVKLLRTVGITKCKVRLALVSGLKVVREVETTLDLGLEKPLGFVRGLDIFHSGCLVFSVYRSHEEIVEWILLHFFFHLLRPLNILG